MLILLWVFDEIYQWNCLVLDFCLVRGFYWFSLLTSHQAVQILPYSLKYMVCLRAYVFPDQLSLFPHSSYSCTYPVLSEYLVHISILWTYYMFVLPVSLSPHYTWSFLRIDNFYCYFLLYTINILNDSWIKRLNEWLIEWERLRPCYLPQHALGIQETNTPFLAHQDLILPSPLYCFSLQSTVSSLA